MRSDLMFMEDEFPERHVLRVARKLGLLADQPDRPMLDSDDEDEEWED